MSPLSPLLILNEKYASRNFVIRPVVKGVVFNEAGQVLLFSGFLPGGGVEEGEDLISALKRECLEETGALVEVGEYLGTVVQYRNFLEKKYEIHGYFCKLIDRQRPTTTQEDEKGCSSEWRELDSTLQTLNDRVNMCEQKIKEDSFLNDREQSQCFHSKTTLEFLMQAKIHREK